MDTIRSIIFIKAAIVFIAALILLGGCASTGSHYVLTPMTDKLTDYKTMVFYVSSQIYESDDEEIQLESITMEKLKKKGLFTKVISGSDSPDASADLRLNAKIVYLKKANRWERLLLDTSPGRAEIVINVELIDMKDRKTIGAFQSEGKSSGTVFGGTSSQAVERAADQIVEFIQKNLK